MKTQIVLWTEKGCAKCKTLLKTLTNDRILDLSEILIVRMGSTSAGKYRAKVPGVAMLLVRGSVKAVFTSSTSAREIIESLEAHDVRNS